MKNRRTKVGAFDRELRHWGQLLTSDHVNSKAKKNIGLGGEKQAFVIKDVFSGLVCLYLVPSKKGSDTEICIKDFIGIPGDRKTKDLSMYSDNSGEIRIACKAIGILHDKSQPGIPQNNAVIERTNQQILTKTIVALLEAGLPPLYWTFAAPCVCVNLNTDFGGGESAYFLTHGVEFPYKRFPFGCKVLYKPSNTKSSEVDGKWAAPSSVGVFAGYVMHPGYKSKGEYLVWDLLDFARGADLSNFACHLDNRLLHPHVSVRCELYDDKLHVELKEPYEKANNTYDGQMAALVRHPLKGTKQTDPPPPHGEGGGNSAGSNDVPDDPFVAEVPVVVAPYPHMREGKASDNRIYLNDSGVKVKLGTNGRPYLWGLMESGCFPAPAP